MVAYFRLGNDVPLPFDGLLAAGALLGHPLDFYRIAIRRLLFSGQDNSIQVIEPNHRASTILAWEKAAQWPRGAVQNSQAQCNPFLAGVRSPPARRKGLCVRAQRNLFWRARGPPPLVDVCVCARSATYFAGAGGWQGGV